MSDRSPITKHGFERLKQTLEQLTKFERPKASKAIGVAREHGDLSENAEYHAAKDAQGMLEARIGQLQALLTTAQVIDTSTIRGDRIVFGAIVRLLDLNTDEEFEYQIVGEFEADTENGRLSVKSPIARHLIGKSKHDFVDIEVPGGVRSLEILDVVYR